ncbi:MAG: hypothetical protein HY033_00675 [Ignavibacteriae bacterium]|nr:hypothetical protein [Ignavibacteriota bacterium]
MRFLSLCVLAFSLSLSINAQQRTFQPKHLGPLDRIQETRLPQTKRRLIPRSFFSLTDFSSIKVNQLATIEPQNEPSIAVNPKNKNNMVAAYRDFYLGSNPAIRNVGIATTTDGGNTWVETHAQYGDHDRFSDPGVAVDTAGNFYVVTLDYNYDSLYVANKGNYLTLRTSTDGGFTWIPQVVAHSPEPGFYDKEMIWVDKSPTSPLAGAIYVAWSGPYGASNFAVSPGPFMPFTVKNAGEFAYPTPTTGPNGELYIFGTVNAIVMYKSTDGGFTLTDSAVVSDGNYPQVGIVSEVVSVVPVVAATADNSISPYRGTVYATWVSPVNGDLDVYLSRSTDSGHTWQPSVRVNNDPIGNGHNQFFPGITVDDSGYVSVVFLDSRNDTANILVDAYLAQSRDGGQTFKNFRLTSQNFDPRINYNGDVRFGDYMGIASSQGRVVPIWTDSHLGNQDVYITLIDSLAYGSSVIAGTVFNDCDGNGIQGPDEPLIPGWSVTLEGETNGAVSTDSLGHFEFKFLIAGSYKVLVDTNGEWAPTSPPTGWYLPTIGSRDTVTVKFGIHHLPPAGYIEDWNLVSVPRAAPDPRPSVLFPNARSSAWAFTEAYTKADSLRNGFGYWIKLGCIPEVSFTGDSVTSLDVPVNGGWNMIGSLAVPIPSVNVSSTPPGIITSAFLGFNGGYSPASTLAPEKGYWVRVSQAGTLHLSNSNAFSRQTTVMPELSSFNSLDSMSKCNTSVKDFAWCLIM